MIGVHIRSGGQYDRGTNFMISGGAPPVGLGCWAAGQSCLMPPLCAVKGRFLIHYYTSTPVSLRHENETFIPYA